MGKAQRDKGARGEREIADLLRAAGFDATRTPLSGGMKWVGDLEHNVPNLHLEIKRAESVHLPAWTRQAEADCPAGKVPVVIYRSSREPWRASLPFEYLLTLLRPVG